jgi:hypothetical protein
MDLDVARKARAETVGGPEPLTLGGRDIAMLPAEFPLDVLEPLVLGVNVDIAMVVRSVVDAIEAEDRAAAGLGLASMLVDLVVGNPRLPVELVDAVKAMFARLIGQAGYDAFVAERPSPEDVMELGKGLLAKYGWSSVGDVLGESTSSADGSNGGTTSTPTSDTTSRDSTSVASGSGPEIPDSSGYGASLPTPSGSPQMPS